MRPPKSCRWALTLAVIVCPGRIENSSGPPDCGATDAPFSPDVIATVTFGFSASWMSPSEPAACTTSRPAMMAVAFTTTALSASSSGATASAEAEKTPIACRCPASISIGP